MKYDDFNNNSKYEVDRFDIIGGACLKKYNLFCICAKILISNHETRVLALDKIP
jgi:hypothetical protein